MSRDGQARELCGALSPEGECSFVCLPVEAGIAWGIVFYLRVSQPTARTLEALFDEPRIRREVADHLVPLLPHEGHGTDVRYDQQARKEEQRAAIVSRPVSVWALELAVESCCSSHSLIRRAGRPGALAPDET